MDAVVMFYLLHSIDVMEVYFKPRSLLAITNFGLWFS